MHYVLARAAQFCLFGIAIAAIARASISERRSGAMRLLTGSRRRSFTTTIRQASCLKPLFRWSLRFRSRSTAGQKQCIVPPSSGGARPGRTRELRPGPVRQEHGCRKRHDQKIPKLGSGGWFLWFALFWLENMQFGFRDESIRYLEQSYELGPSEGWIALKRNGYARLRTRPCRNDCRSTWCRNMPGL